MTSIQQLKQAHERLQALRPLSAEALAQLRHLFEVRLSYHSTAIEGNTLTQSETQIVIEKGITIAGKSVAEHLEIIGHKEAMDFVESLADDKEPLTQRRIKEIHSLVMKGQSGYSHGTFRRLDVRAAGTEFVYPSHLHLHELMENFEGWLAAPSEMHPAEFASEAHLRFVTIHPFQDGNGRVGRLLMNFLLLRAGYPIAVIPVERRAEYIDALVFAQEPHGSRAKLDELVFDAIWQGFETVFEVMGG